MGVEKKGSALLFWRWELEFDDHRHLTQEKPYVLLKCRLVIPGVDLRPYGVCEGELIPWIPT